MLLWMKTQLVFGGTSSADIMVKQSSKFPCMIQKKGFELSTIEDRLLSVLLTCKHHFCVVR